MFRLMIALGTVGYFAVPWIVGPFGAVPLLGDVANVLATVAGSM